jgi:hypothetical protein
MSREELILYIKDSLRAVNSLPYSISDEEINRIIDLSKRFFYLHYLEATEPHFYVIRKDVFLTQAFSKTRSVILPECVVAINEVREINSSSSIFGIRDKDITDERFIASELYAPQLTGDGFLLMTVRMSFWDLAKVFLLDTVAFDFNSNTRKLTFVGRNPKKDVWIKAFIKIPEEKLFEDYYFLSYCIAEAKISLANVLSLIKYKVPGGIEINAENMYSDAKDEKEKIIEAITDKWSPPDFMILSHD